MMADNLASDVNISEEDPTIRSSSTLATAVLGVLGVTLRGPIGVPVLVTSYSEFEEVYGSFLASYHTAQTVRAFFLNGGQFCYVVRTVHYSNYKLASSKTASKGELTLKTEASGSASAATLTGSLAGPWKLSPGDTLIAAINRAANETATFDAAAAAVECGSADTYVLTDGMLLTVKIDSETSAQVITFNTADFVAIATATAEEVAQVINEDLKGAKATVTSSGTKVTITSDTKGTGSAVEVTGGTANTPLGFSTSPVSGTGDVADIDAVTVTEVETVLEAAWLAGGGSAAVAITSSAGAVKITTVLTGATSYIEVKATSTCETIFGLSTTEVQGGNGTAQDTLKIVASTEGTYFNTLQHKISAATNGDAFAFNYTILDAASNIVEIWPNVDISTIEALVNDDTTGSDLVVVEDLALAGTTLQRRPVNVSGATATTAGADGLTSLDDTDFTGDEDEATGLYAFDEVDDLTLLVVPDRCTALMHTSMLIYCGMQRKGYTFAILDTPASKTRTGIINYVASLSAASKYYEYGAMYWPRVRIVNPAKSVFGSSVKSIDCPASGYIAGIMAYNDAEQEEGPFYQPAGTEAASPTGVIGLEGEDGTKTNLHSARKLKTRKLVFPKRINPICVSKKVGVFIDGARTLKGDGNFPHVGTRRGVSHIERLLDMDLDWVRHRNNTPDLRIDVYMQVYALLKEWMDKGAFASKDPTTAFKVDVSDKLNPPSKVKKGELNLRIGLATNTPAEFINVKVTKDTRALLEELGLDAAV
jgi:uncharacterized protein